MMKTKWTPKLANFIKNFTEKQFMKKRLEDSETEEIVLKIPTFSDKKVNNTEGKE